MSLVSGQSGGADSIPLFYSARRRTLALPRRHSGQLSILRGRSTSPTWYPASALPTISAAFSPTAITSPQTSTLTLTIANPNAGTALTGVAVAAAALPANLTGSSPATTCTSGTATFSAGSLSLSGASLNASASCTVTLTVTSTVAATYNYTTGVVSSSSPSTTGTTATTSTGLTVSAAVSATQSIASKTLTQNFAATSFTPVTGGGGRTPLSYSISPALPTGLSIASATGAITGTPTVTSAAATYTVTVTDANNATATNTFSLTVNSAVAATQAIASKVLTQNFAVVFVHAGHRFRRHRTPELQRVAGVADWPQHRLRHRRDHGNADGRERGGHLYRDSHRRQQRHRDRDLQPDRQ